MNRSRKKEERIRKKMKEYMRRKEKIRGEKRKTSQSNIDKKSIWKELIKKYERKVKRRRGKVDQVRILVWMQ